MQHNAGGLGIANDARVTESCSLNPLQAQIPRIRVDFVVVARPENHWQTFGTQYNPAFSSEIRVRAGSLPPMPMSERKIIARRAAFELKPNSVVNLGIGMPDGIAAVANEEGIIDLITLTAEPGTIGGIPASGIDFGAAINTQAVIDQPYQVYFYGAGAVLELDNQLGEPGVWSPDGQTWVASEYFEEVQNLLEPTSSGHLLSYALERAGQVRDLTQANNIEDVLPVFSPDGQHLAFARKYLDPQRWTNGRQVWVLDSATGAARAFTDEPYYTHYDFAWSPDSSQLAYVRFNQVVLTEPAELWLINADGGQPLQLVIGAFRPQWLP